MLDIKHFIEFEALYRKSITNRNVQADISKVMRLYQQRNALLQENDALKQERNNIAKLSANSGNQEERQSYIDKGKSLKTQITNIDTTLKEYEQELEEAALRIPNLCHPDSPIGKEEKHNLEIKRVGEPTTFSFAPKDHIVLGKSLDIVDFETATSITAPKFYFLKNEAVLLELALLRFGITLLQKKGFSIYTTPDLAKQEIIHKLGFNPRGAESNIYCLEDENLGLIGTSEITLGAYHANSILNSKDLPIKMAGISHCYRKEAGAAGQFSKGLYRVHQFSKLEMIILCLPEQSEALHMELLSIEESLYTALAIPYRVVDTCTGDLGNPAYRKFDIEAWMPGRGDGDYGEVTSASNCTDYQTKRLKIRTQNAEKQKTFPHMLNGTAIAVPRTLVAILENFQQENGSVTIPEVLVPYCGFDSIKPKMLDE